jgi:hypothetical protein
MPINKKYIILIGAASAFLVLGAAAAFFLSGSGQPREFSSELQPNGASPDNPGARKESSLEKDQPQSNDGWITSGQKAVAEAAAAEPEKSRTSVEKINNAFRKKGMSESEAVKLRLTALIEPDKLPAEYQGETPKGRSTLNRDTKWILQQWENLTEEQKQDFQPYILPPDEEGSVFYPEDKKTSSLFIQPAYAASSGWYAKEAGLPAKAKVNYWLDGSWSEAEINQRQAKAEAVKQALLKAWPMFDNLFGLEPTEKVYVYLVDMEDYGEAYMGEKEGAKRCLINLKQDEDDKTLKASTAHELFHCFQYSFSPKYEKIVDDVNWLAEATAVWSESLVYPAFNSEHIYLDEEFFPYLHEEFMYADGIREYGHYTWFYFMGNHYANADYVARVLEAGADGPIRESLQIGLADYDEAYRQFSYYNWNSRPFLKYEDDPPFPEILPQGDALKYENRFEEDKQEYPVTLKPGSMRYYVFAFDPGEDGAHFARVKVKEHADNVSVTAMFKQAVNPRTEDWSQPEKREFCVTDNDTEMLILALANSDQSREADLVFDFEMESECPLVPHGYIKIEEKTDSPMGGTSVVMRSEEVLEYNKEDGAYDIVKRTVTCEKSSMMEQPAMYGAPAYRVEKNGTGSLNETYYDIEDRPWRIYMKGGREESLNIAPDTLDQGWVKSTTKTTGSPATTENTTCASVWPADYTLKPDQVTEYGIKGSDTLDVAHLGGIGTLEIEFEYWYK